MKRLMGLSAALAAGLLGTILAVAGHAGATSIETGSLLIHGPGSVFSGSHTFVSASALAGSATTFTVDVSNTGSVAGQFNLKVAKVEPSTNSTTVAVTAGGLNVASQATSADGYFTPAIAAHKVLAYTVKVTAPKTSPNNARFFTSVVLSDVKGVKLDTVQTETQVRATTGTTDYDMFVTGAGQSPLLGNGLYNAVTAPAIKVGATSTFTVKLQNDGPTPVNIGLKLVDVRAALRTSCRR